MSASPTPLIVAGFHRSGTSLMMQTLARAGLSIGDDLLAASPSNPDGHFEHRGIVRFHDRLLGEQGGNWHHPPQTRVHRHSPSVNEARRLVDSIPKGAAPCWGFKDPRVCLFMPLWNAALENPLCVIVYRDPIACLNSLLRREAQKLTHQTQRDASQLVFWREPDHALALWCIYNEALLREIERAPKTCLVWSFTELIYGTSPTAHLNQAGDLGLDDTIPTPVAGDAPDCAVSMVPRAHLSDKNVARAQRVLNALNVRAIGQKERMGTLQALSCSNRTPQSCPQQETVTHSRLIRSLQSLHIEALRSRPQSQTTLTARPYQNKEVHLRNEPAHQEIARGEHKTTLAVEAGVNSDAQPADPSLAMQAADAWRAAGDDDKALDYYHRALAAGAHGHATLMRLGQLTRKAGDLHAAEGFFRQALEQAPQRADLHAYLAETLAQQGNVDAAHQLAIRGIAHEPAQPLLLDMLVAAALARNDLASARRLVDEATRATPKSWRAAQLDYDITLYAQPQQPREAQPLRRRALALRLPGVSDCAAKILDPVRQLSEAALRIALSDAVADECELLARAVQEAERRVASTAPSEQAATERPSSSGLGKRAP